MKSLLIGALLFGCCMNANALEYRVDGASPRQVTVDDGLLLGGTLAFAVGYLTVLSLGTMAVAFEPEEENNRTMFKLSTIPIANGALVGQHTIDVAKARNARGGEFLIGAGFFWIGTLAQVAGLSIVSFAFLSGERTPISALE